MAICGIYQNGNYWPIFAQCILFGNMTKKATELHLDCGQRVDWTHWHAKIRKSTKYNWETHRKATNGDAHGKLPRNLLYTATITRRTLYKASISKYKRHTKSQYYVTSKFNNTLQIVLDDFCYVHTWSCTQARSLLIWNTI